MKSYEKPSNLNYTGFVEPPELLREILAALEHISKQLEEIYMTMPED